MEIALPLGCRVFVAQSKIERQAARNLEIILQITEIHALPVLRQRDVAQLVGRARAKEKVGDVVQIVALASRRASELTTIGILAVLRLEVVDFGVEQLVFQAGLE